MDIQEKYKPINGPCQHVLKKTKQNISVILIETFAQDLSNNYILNAFMFPRKCHSSIYCESVVFADNFINNKFATCCHHPHPARISHAEPSTLTFESILYYTILDQPGNILVDIVCTTKAQNKLKWSVPEVFIISVCSLLECCILQKNIFCFTKLPQMNYVL